MVEGLLTIGENVAVIAEEMESCNEAGAFRAARLLYNVGREEAGKFLILIDAYRAPHSDQVTISRQFGRARDHLSKLVYAQMADYSIGSQEELVSAVTDHRQALYLDGLNGYEWIFRNELLLERESTLYTDLVETDGELSWWRPYDCELPVSVPRSMQLVASLITAGIASVEGLGALRMVWSGFNPQNQSHSSDWTARTTRALHEVSRGKHEDGQWQDAAVLVQRRWPMPMVELPVEEERVDIDTLMAEREARHEAEMRWQHGFQ